MTAEVGAGLAHDTERADVETSSADYASRFAGPVGEWMLEVQARGVLALLRDARAPLRVLEVGGGHGQLTRVLQSAGHRVTVQASGVEGHARWREPQAGTSRVASNLWRLPFPDASFDAVIAIRLLAHVRRWQELLAEMARVSARWLLVDFPARTALHHLAPALFGAKRRIESNTRPYFDYELEQMEQALARLGLRPAGRVPEFALPMVVHRAVGRRGFSSALEALARRLGLVEHFGSPVLLLAERAPALQTAIPKEDR